MSRMIYKGAIGERFELSHNSGVDFFNDTYNNDDPLTLVWVIDGELHAEVDAIALIFQPGDFFCLSHLHKVSFTKAGSYRMLSFNRAFYCVLNHDSQVGCKGVLFYSAARLPSFRPNQMEMDILSTAWHMASLEFEMKDNLQGEMLRMMLKRVLILCTRIYKQTEISRAVSSAEHNLIREFNFLVERHFRNVHHVADYASMLNKSAKTIANVFKMIGDKSPLQIIHDRILLEARRLLWYSDLQVSEIAYQLGFEDVQSFSRFFKNKQSVSPTVFREIKLSEHKLTDNKQI